MGSSAEVQRSSPSTSSQTTPARSAWSMSGSRTRPGDDWKKRLSCAHAESGASATAARAALSVVMLLSPQACVQLAHPFQAGEDALPFLGDPADVVERL